MIKFSIALLTRISVARLLPLIKFYTDELTLALKNFTQIFCKFSRLTARMRVLVHYRKQAWPDQAEITTNIMKGAPALELECAYENN